MLPLRYSMSKKLIITFIIFVAAISALIYVNVPTANPVSRKLTPSPAKQISAQAASFSFFPNPLTILSGQNASVDVKLDTKINTSLVQLEIAYDPRYVYGVSIFPANYFADPEIVLEKIDTKNGRISYALQGNTVNRESNIVATINFSTIGTASPTETKLEFLPKTTLKTNEDVAITNVLPAQIILKPSLVAPLASPSSFFQTQ
jgi:hypothetical protein